MAVTTILGLPIAVLLDGEEYFPLVQGLGQDATTKRVTLNEMLALAYPPSDQVANRALSNLLNVAINTTLLPGVDDGAGLGSGTLSFSDLFLASGGVINWANGDVTITHSSNTLAFAGASSGYTFDSAVFITGLTTLRSGSFSGGIIVGADAGGTTITNATRKLARFVVPGYNTTDLPLCVLSGDAQSGSNSQLDFGGVVGSATIAAATTLRFIAAAAPNTAGGTLIMQIMTTGVLPGSNDGAPLGAGTVSWSDLFLASGGVINWNNGDVTITHSSNVLTFSTSNSVSNPWIFSNNTGASTIDIRRNEIVADNTILANIRYVGLNDASSVVAYAATQGLMVSDVAGAHVGALAFLAATSGAMASRMVMSTSALYPTTNDALALGTATNSWSDLFLASGGVINWNNGTVTLSETSGQLILTRSGGATGIYIQGAGNAFLEFGRVDGFASNPLMDFHSGATAVDYDFRMIASGGTGSNGGGSMRLIGADFSPSSNDGVPLGTTSTSWSDLFLASGGVINWNNGNVLLTHSSGTLAMTAAGATFGVTSTTGNSAVLMGRSDAHAASATLTAFAFIGLNTTPVQYVYGQLNAQSVDNTAGSEDGQILFQAAIAGALTTQGVLGAATWRPGTNDGTALGTATNSWSDLFLASGGVINFNNGNLTMTHSSGALAITGVTTLASSVATPAGGSTTARLLLGTTAGFGIYYGSGAPTVSAAQGSIYLRSDGAINARLYINTNGSTTWTAFNTAA